MDREACHARARGPYELGTAPVTTQGEVNGATGMPQRTSDDAQIATLTWFRPSIKQPLWVVGAGLVFLYVFQYPVWKLLSSPVTNSYTVEEWVGGYVFVVVSCLILVFAMLVGMAGGPVLVEATSRGKRSSRRWRRPQPLGLTKLLLIFAVLFGWSYLMLNLKIGMTIYADFEPLPFRLVGILFYGRLFLQPMVVAYLASAYSSSRLKPLILLLVMALGAWTSATSGSHFIGIMFALPLLLLFPGAKGLVAFAVSVSGNIMIATVTRHFFLPFIIGGDYPLLYAAKDYQDTILQGLLILPLSYLAGRTMGISEVLLTLRYGNIAPSFTDSLEGLLAYYLPFFIPGTGASTKNIYGFGDDAFGGFGLGLFPNYWVAFGGSWITYALGIGIAGWLLGKCYRLFAIALKRAGFQEGIFVVFIFLFLLVFEARAFLLPAFLVVGSLLSQRRIQAVLRAGVQWATVGALRDAVRPARTI